MKARPALTALLLTIPAWAEVTDKEPTLPEIWSRAALAAVFAWLLGRILPGFGCLALVPALPAVSAVFECYDKFVGPAILREAGAGYVAQAHMAAGSVLLAFVHGFSHRRSARPSASPPGIHTRE